MKLPNFRRLNTQDYEEEDKGLVEQLAASLNYGIEVLYDALNKKITLRDNIACSVRDITLAVNSSGIPKTKTTMSLDSNTTVIGTQVIFAEGNSAVTSTPFIYYTQNGALLQIQRVTGLPADINFNLRIVAYT